MDNFSLKNFQEISRIYDEMKILLNTKIAVDEIIINLFLREKLLKEDTNEMVKIHETRGRIRHPLLSRMLDSL